VTGPDRELLAFAADRVMDMEVYAKTGAPAGEGGPRGDPGVRGADGRSRRRFFIGLEHHPAKWIPVGGKRCFYFNNLERPS
jgi:hypothetical protein